MRSVRIVWPVLLAALATLACGPTVRYRSLSTSLPPLSPRSPESIDILMGGLSGRPHVDVALIEVEEPPWGADTSVLLQALRERAARAGCEAVVVTSMSVDDNMRSAVWGTCIHYVAS